MVLVMQQPIGATLEQLRQNVAAANNCGNIEGLLAWHALSSDARVEFPWEVDCDAGWLRENYDPRSLPSIAALAFTIDAHRGEPFDCPRRRDAARGGPRPRRRKPKCRVTKSSSSCRSRVGCTMSC